MKVMIFRHLYAEHLLERMHTLYFDKNNKYMNPLVHDGKILKKIFWYMEQN